MGVLLALLLQAGVDGVEWRPLREIREPRSAAEAALRGNAALLEAMLADNVDPKAPLDAKFGWTPLHCAVDSGSWTCVAALLKAGVDVDAKALRPAETALSFAVRAGDAAMSASLIKAGAKIDDEIQRRVPSWAGPELRKALGIEVPPEGPDKPARKPLPQDTLYWAILRDDPERFHALWKEKPDPNQMLSSAGSADVPILVHAVQWNRGDLAAFLVKAGANTNWTDAKGLTLLGLALEKSQADAAAGLLEAGFDPLKTGSSRKGVVLVAASTTNARLMKAALAARLRPDLRNADQETPLVLLAKNPGRQDGRTDSILALLKARADVDAASKEGKTALQLLLAEEYAPARRKFALALEGLKKLPKLSSLDEAVRLGLSQLSADLAAPATAAERAAGVALALRLGFDDIADWMANETLDLNAGPGETSALYEAIQRDDAEWVKRLIDAGASPVRFVRSPAPSFFEGTLLSLALARGNEAVIAALGPAGHRPVAAGAPGRLSTPLAYAGARPRRLSRLLNAGAELDVLHLSQETALFDAIEDNERHVAIRLMIEGANANLPDVQGRVPLVVAIQKGGLGAQPSLAQVEDLLAAGADPNAGPAGKTPSELAVLSGSLPLMEALKKAGGAIPEEKFEERRLALAQAATAREVDALVAQAEAALNANDLPLLRARVEAILKLEAKHAKALALRATLRMRSQPPDLPGALADLDVAVPELGAQFPQIHLQRAELLIVLEKPERAEEDATVLVTLIERNRVKGRPSGADAAKIYLMRAQVRTRQNKLDLAQQDADQAVKDHATNADAWFLKGLLHHHRKEPDACKLALQKAVDLKHPRAAAALKEAFPAGK